MDAYIIESAKNNGQLIIDLPAHLHHKNVKITIDEIISVMPSEEALENVYSVYDQVEGIIPARKKIDLSTLRGKLKLNMTIDEIDSLTKSWRNEWERDLS